MNQRSITSRFLRLIMWLIVTCVVVSVVPVLALRWLNPPVTAFMLLDRVEARQNARPYPLQYEWSDWPAISTPMKIAVIASEDQTFPTHHGFDLKSINTALEERNRGQRVRGASTLSQQVAKNLFLWPGKSWVRKGLEAWFTVLIEVLWPKTRILEMHLNIAQFGRGIYGVNAAAKVFFCKPASRLSASEAALLAAVLPNPIRLKANAPTKYLRSRQTWIVGQMNALEGSRVLEQLQ